MFVNSGLTVLTLFNALEVFISIYNEIKWVVFVYNAWENWIALLLHKLSSLITGLCKVVGMSFTKNLWYIRNDYSLENLFKNSYILVRSLVMSR